MANPFDQFMQPHGLPDFSQFGGQPQPNPMPQPPAMGGATSNGLGTLTTPSWNQGGQNPLQQLLMLLPLLVAAKQGGGAGVGGFAQGYLSSRQYLDQQQRMAEAMQMRQEQELYERQRQERADQERRQKAAAEILLGAGQPLLERTMSTLDQMPGLDPDAVATEQANAYAAVIRKAFPGIELTGPDFKAVMPDVKTQYSARLQRHANEVLSSYEGKYAEKDLQALGPKIPFNGRAVTIDELRGIAGKATGLTPIKEQEKTKPVYRLSPDKTKIEPVGEVPEGAQVVSEPQPPRVSVNMPGGQGAGGLTPEGIEFAATMLRVTGNMPPLGMGGGPERKQIINAAAAQARALKQTPAVAIQKQAAYKADSAALQQMRKMGAAAEAFETKALAQADIVQEYSDKVGRSKYPILNSAILAGKREIEGDPDAQLLLNAITTFSTEYAKIMEGSTGSVAASTDASRKAAERLIHTKLNPAQITKVLELMRREMRLTIDGYNATAEHITQRQIGGAPSPAPQEGGGTEVWVFGPDGKLHPKGKGQ